MLIQPLSHVVRNHMNAALGVVLLFVLLGNCGARSLPGGRGMSFLLVRSQQSRRDLAE